MKILNKLFFMLVLLLTAGVTAYAQKETPPEGGTPRDFTLPPKKESTLDNGLRATLVQYGALPKVNINVIIKTGNVHEGPEEVWLADLTASMMKEGTASRDFKAIAETVAGMGGQVNVNAGLNQFTISGSVLSEFAPDLIGVLADIAINPAFPEGDLERLKTDLKRNLAVQKTVPQQQAQAKFRSIIYEDHPYGRYFPTEEMLDSYTLEQVKGFYDKNIGAQRTVVYVVGKFDEGRVSEAIKESFGGWREGPEVNYPVAEPEASSEVAMIDRSGAPQTTIVLGLPTLDPTKDDYVPLQVTNALLGGSFGSRITSNIREDKGYTYSPFSTINTGYRVAVWYEQADVTTEHTGASLQEIAKEIRRLQNEPPSAEELKGIQNYQAGLFVLQNSTPGGIIGQLNFIDFHGLPESYLTNQVKRIHSVTPEQVQQLAKAHIRYEDMTLVLVGDEKELEKQIKAHEDALKIK